MGRVVGIIAEYNPFHNGHLYHIEEAKRKANADFCVCIMSGNFTQRGEPSIVNKWAKSYMALCGGADLVIELPVTYSISSAENFAEGAIKILNSLGIVTDLAFGAECDDIGTLNNIANVLYEEPTKYKTILNHELKKGISYPAARENAVLMYLNDVKRYANVLSGSNNILAIEYLKALKKQKSKINPIAVKRQKVYYNDDMIVDDFASSTAIRKFFINKEYKEVQRVVPRSTYKILGEEFKNGNMILSLKEFEKEIIFNLRKMSLMDIENLPDVSEGLENLIKKAANESKTIEDLIDRIKSKRYTQTRIQRILLYSLLGIDKRMIETSKKITPYARVLAFNGKGRKLLSEIMSQNKELNLVTSVNKFVSENIKKRNYRPLMEMLDKDMLATDIYALGCDKDHNAKMDYTHNMIIIK